MLDICIKSDRICRLAAWPFPFSSQFPHLSVARETTDSLSTKYSLTGTASYHPRQGERKKIKVQHIRLISYKVLSHDLKPYHRNATHNFSTPPCQFCFLDCCFAPRIDSICLDGKKARILLVDSSLIPDWPFLGSHIFLCLTGLGPDFRYSKSPINPSPGWILRSFHHSSVKLSTGKVEGATIESLIIIIIINLGKLRSV